MAMNTWMKAPRRTRYDKVILKDLNGVEFELNRKNYYKHKSLFFKGMDFNRWADVWKILRKQTVFKIELNGKITTVALYDVRECLEYSKNSLKAGFNVNESKSTIDYCNDVLDKGCAYVIIDGQNRETMNSNWYEGKLYIQEYKGWVRNKDKDAYIDISKTQIPTKKIPRYMNWYIPGYKQMKENRGERTYNYQSEITDTTFLDAVDNGIIPVDLYTECYRSQMSDVYETYNLKENNSPIELRNALPGELSHHKRSLFYRDEFEQFYTDSDLTKMKNHISYFENNNVNPIDSYYGVTNLNESRYGGMQAFEDETLFLDNSSKNADAKDPDYRRLYKKYQFDLPKFYDVHNKLILQRAKLYNAYNPKEAGLTVGKSINFDFFTFLYDLNNPMDMLKEEEVLPTYILTDKQKNEMTQNELDDFGFSVKIVDYKGLMQFVTDECLIEEMDNHTKKIVDGKTIKNWDTETEYFKHLRDNKNWTLRRKFYRGHFLASLPMLMTKKIVVVKDTTRVVTDKTFRDILRQQGGKDSRGNVVESMLKLKKKYAKSHTYPHSWGVDENGLTIGKFTSIFTQEENRKIGAQVHV